MYCTFYIASKSVLDTLDSVKKCILDSLSVRFEVTVPNTENVSMQTLMKALILVTKSACAHSCFFKEAGNYRKHANFDC